MDLAAGFSEYASLKVPTVGEEIGRRESSVLRLVRLCRGEDGVDE